MKDLNLNAQVINTDTYEISEPFIIPSSITLARLDSISHDELYNLN